MVKPMNMAECYAGLSTDDKPYPVYNGSCFIEMDTGKVYFFNAADGTEAGWLEWGGSSDDPDTPNDGGGGEVS